MDCIVFIIILSSSIAVEVMTVVVIDVEFEVVLAVEEVSLKVDSIRSSSRDSNCKSRSISSRSSRSMLRRSRSSI